MNFPYNYINNNYIEECNYFMELHSLRKKVKTVRKKNPLQNHP